MASDGTDYETLKEAANRDLRSLTENFAAAVQRKIENEEIGLTFHGPRFYDYVEFRSPAFKALPHGALPEMEAYQNLVDICAKADLCIGLPFDRPYNSVIVTVGAGFDQSPHAPEYAQKARKTGPKP